MELLDNLKSCDQLRGLKTKKNTKRLNEVFQNTKSKLISDLHQWIEKYEPQLDYFYLEKKYFSNSELSDIVDKLNHKQFHLFDLEESLYIGIVPYTPPDS